MSRKTSDGDFRVVLYSNRRKNHDGYFWKSDIQKVNHAINVWLEAHRSSLKRKADSRAEQAKVKATTPKPQELAQIGDIFVSLFGYDETHYEFYQLVEFKGKTMGVFRKIGAHYDYDHQGFAQVTPVKDAFAKDYEPIAKQLKVCKFGENYLVAFRVNSHSSATQIKGDDPFVESSFRR